MPGWIHWNNWLEKDNKWTSKYIWLLILAMSTPLGIQRILFEQIFFGRLISISHICSTFDVSHWFNQSCALPDQELCALESRREKEFHKQGILLPPTNLDCEHQLSFHSTHTHTQVKFNSKQVNEPRWPRKCGDEESEGWKMVMPTLANKNIH